MDRRSLTIPTWTRFQLMRGPQQASTDRTIASWALSEMFPTKTVTGGLPEASRGMLGGGPLGLAMKGCRGLMGGPPIMCGGIGGGTPPNTPGGGCGGIPGIMPGGGLGGNDIASRSGPSWTRIISWPRKAGIAVVVELFNGFCELDIIVVKRQSSLVKV